jgi:DNA-binding PadR family transcriptional regulator
MPTNLGEFEQLVILALMQLDDQAYGVTIRREIAERTSRETGIGAVYKTLERLEQKGLVAARMGEPTPERGGRRKKYFKATPAGVRAVRQALRAVQGMAAGLDLLKGERFHG